MNGILLALQRGLPLVERPFAALGHDESVVLEVLRAALADGRIRRLGALLDAGRLGWSSALCAVAAGADAERLAARIAAEKGVTHLYERRLRPGLPCAAVAALPDLWFTFSAPSPVFPDRLSVLTQALAPQRLHVLPALRRYKVGAIFGDGGAEAPAPTIQALTEPTWDDLDRRLLPVLQEDLPAEPVPWTSWAEAAGLTVSRLLTRLETWRADGRLKRVAAVVRHQRLGVTANLLGAWSLAEPAWDGAGAFLAARPSVTHCYVRSRDGLPCDLFAMMHAGSWTAVEALYRDACDHLGPGLPLATGREYKKTSLRFA